MKKIININLSGRVIPIEDSAYEKLQSYIESLRRYFANEEGRDEIINDIESRIAELMSEKIRLGSAAITDSDVSEIIATMGTVEDFEAVENETAATDNSTSSQQGSENKNYSFAREKRRVYRDSSNKMLGGVCAGLANYLNVDPAIIRLLFAILFFGGFGFLIYIILWIVLPPRDLDQYQGKRLYRNPEDKVFGGVAGGLAAYFNKSTSVVRLIFAAPIILNILIGVFSWPFFHEGSFLPNIVFGSLTGTFIFAYIVLWIILPEARSQYQKMEMRGEKVDVNSIRQNVKEGMENMKDRVKGWGQEVKESAQNLSGKAKEFAGSRSKSFAAEAREAAGRTSRGLGHIIGVIFKAFFLFVAGSIAFGLFVALIGLLIGGIGIWPFTNFLLDGFWQNAFAWGTLVLFLGVPLIGFIIWLLRRIMKVRSQNNYLGWTFGGLWTLGWISVSLLVASLYNDFRMDNDRTGGQEIQIVQPVNGKMIVKVSEPEIEYNGSIPWIHIDGSGMDITRDTLRLANVKIRVEQSKDAAFHVEIKKYSLGKNRADAEDKAQHMVFNTFYSDSVLDVGSGIAIDRATKYRGQQAIVTIKVPAGKKIRFDETVDKLHTFNIRVSDRRWNRRGRNFDIDMDEYFDYKTDVDYTMGDDGILKDPAGMTVTQPAADYRYPVADTIQRKIDSIREESERKIKDLKENKKTEGQKPNVFNEKNKAVNKDGFVAAGPSVYSLAQWF